MKKAPIRITQFKWGGKLGPFHIKSTCNECDLTSAILKNMMENELKDKDVELDIRPWLDNFFYCLFRGAWHAPIVMVNGKRFHQFNKKEPLFNKQKLIELVNRLEEGVNNGKKDL